MITVPAVSEAPAVTRGTSLPSRFVTWWPSHLPLRAPRTMTAIGMTDAVKATTNPHSSVFQMFSVAAATANGSKITQTHGASTSVAPRATFLIKSPRDPSVTLQTSLRSVAQRESSYRLESWVFRRTLDTCVSTVLTLMNSSDAISL